MPGQDETGRKGEIEEWREKKEEEPKEQKNEEEQKELINSIKNFKRRLVILKCRQEAKLFRHNFIHPLSHFDVLALESRPSRAHYHVNIEKHARG